MKWTRALDKKVLTLLLPDGKAENVLIKYDQGQQRELGSANLIKELYNNGWDDMEWLDETDQASPDGWSRDELIRTITAIPLSVLKDDGVYFKAGNDKRFVAFKWENGVALLSIREDGDTRTVFSGIITTIADFKKVWQLTI
jgi:hypothetical protein